MAIAPSFRDLVDQGQAEAQARRPTLRFLVGSIAQAMMHGAAAMGDACVRYSAQLFRQTFLDGATGEALAALVNDRYSLQKILKTRAVVTVEFSRTDGTKVGAIDAGTTVATAVDASGNEVRFTTDAAIAVGGGVLGPLAITATATEPGRGGNADAGAVTRILDQLFDDFTVTNPAEAAGGNDAETDPELRQRARQFFQTRARGTKAAIAFGAREVEEVRLARVTVDALGLITVTVSDADGGSTPQMIADVEANLVNYVAAGDVFTVVGGTPLVQDVTAVLTLAAGADIDVLRPPVQQAMRARIDGLDPGETLYLDQLTAAAIAVDPVGIRAVAFSEPTSDVTPAVGQVIRPGTITVS